MGVEQSLPSFFNDLEINVVGYAFPAKYLYAGLFLFMVFLLVFMMARVRRHFFDWSVRGSVIGIILGFGLALVLEGFLILAGRTALTEILGWENAPEPVQTALDSGRTKLVETLGVTDEIPISLAQEEFKAQSVVDVFQLLDADEAQAARELICSP